MGEPYRILIVDDDENIRKVLEAILEDEGVSAFSKSFATLLETLAKKVSETVRGVQI